MTPSWIPGVVFMQFVGVEFVTSDGIAPGSITAAIATLG
jgi:hypothetical protein